MNSSVMITAVSTLLGTSLGGGITLWTASRMYNKKIRNDRFTILDNDMKILCMEAGRFLRLYGEKIVTYPHQKGIQERHFHWQAVYDQRSTVHGCASACQISHCDEHWDKLLRRLVSHINRSNFSIDKIMTSKFTPEIAVSTHIEMNKYNHDIELVLNDLVAHLHHLKTST